MNLVAAALKQQVGGTAKATKAQNVSFSRSDTTVDYMFSEMINNARSNTTRGIRSQLDLANDLSTSSGVLDSIQDGLIIAGGTTPGSLIQSALITWGLKVRPGGDWDHKPILADKLGLKKEGDYYFPIRGNNTKEVFYDVWSNIHYGYVGSAAGFDARTLQEGAAVADGIAGRNDPVDVLTVQIGIDLWKKYGTNMTKEQFRQEVVRRIPDIVAAQQTPEYRNNNGDFRHVIDIRNGNGR
jgi:hypothetical protein